MLENSVLGLSLHNQSYGGSFFYSLNRSYFEICLGLQLQEYYRILIPCMGIQPLLTLVCYIYNNEMILLQYY